MHLNLVQEAVAGRGGAVVLTYSPDHRAPDRPVALLLHGALGAAGALLGALPVFATDHEPVAVDLPGHGRSAPPPAVSLDGFADEIAQVIHDRFAGRRLVLVGESFGGLVALALARRCAVEAVLAVDPPLSTAKQWHVGVAFRHVMGERPTDPFVPVFARNLFGITAGSPLIEERLYYPLFDDLAAPTALVTGDVPLGPPRPAPATPCCLDAVDEYIVGRLTAGRVAIERVDGVGHVVLREKPAACRDALRRLTGRG